MKQILTSISPLSKRRHGTREAEGVTKWTEERLGSPRITELGQTYMPRYLTWGYTGDYGYRYQVTFE